MRSRRSERGSATAETAVVLPVVVLAVAVVLAAASIGNAQLRCQDAARAGARVVARGEAVAAVDDVVVAVAPGGARTSVVAVVAGPARVDVEVGVAPFGGGPGGAWRVSLTCSATAWPETSVAG